MKKILLPTLTTAFTIAIALNFSACSDTSNNTPKYQTVKDKVELNISFVDKKWDGKKVPKDEVCSDYNPKGGNSPALTISNLPKKVNYLILSFSDETFKGMSNGGHGIVGYKVKDANSTVTIPSIKGETFSLPTGFNSIRKHQGEQFKKKKGAYLPPCSGGNGNLYVIEVKAIERPSTKDGNYTLWGDANISIGVY